MRLISVLLLAAGVSSFAADGNIAKVSDAGLSSAESEVVALAEAMPADKYSFAPTQGSFNGVRTFGQQMTHIATINYMIAAALLGEKVPIDVGKDENGGAALQTKDAAVKYLKDSYAYTHKALSSLTMENYLGMVKSPFGPGEMSRAAVAAVPVWHTFDHYGQAVVYARMNGIVPPASRH